MSSISDVLQEVDDLIEKYELIESTYSPASLKQAVKDAWDGGQNIEELLVSLVPYSLRGADKQRLISMNKAMAALRDLEEQLVGSLIPRWDDILFSQIFGLAQTVVQGIVAIVTNWDLTRKANIVVKFWRIINRAYEMSGMVTVAKVVFAVEQRYELQIASKKMKQNLHAKRQRKNKITRA